MPLVAEDHKYVQNKKHLMHTDRLDYLHIRGTNHFTLTDLVRTSPILCLLFGGSYARSGEDGLLQINQAALAFFDKHLKASGACAELPFPGKPQASRDSSIRDNKNAPKSSATVSTC